MAVPRRPRVGVVFSATAANHGLSSRLANDYAAAFRRLGHDVEILPIMVQDPRSLRTLLRPDLELLFCHGGYFISPQGALGPGFREELDRAGVPLAILVADPPFDPTIGEILRNLPRRAAIFFCDPSFAHGIGHWIPSGVHAPYIACVSPEDLSREVTERPIPPLFAGFFFPPDSIIAEARASTAYFPLVTALIDTALPDYNTPLLRHAAQIAPRLGIEPAMDDPRFRLSVHYADHYVRGRRRGLLLRQLLRHPVRVIANLVPKVSDQHPNAVVTPPVSHAEFHRLLRHARGLVVVQPHFPGAINERIIHAMAAGCPVITTANPRLAQMFTPNQDLWCLDPDFSNLTDAIQRATTEQARRMTWERMRPLMLKRHMPENNLRYMLGVMRAGGLLDDRFPVPPGPALEIPPEPAWTPGG